MLQATSRCKTRKTRKTLKFEVLGPRSTADHVRTRELQSWSSRDQALEAPKVPKVTEAIASRGRWHLQAKHPLRRLSEHPSKSCVPTYLSTKPTSAATVRPLQFIKSEQNTLGSFLPSNFPSKERGLKKNCDKEWQRNTSCTSGVGSNCYDVDMLLSSYDCTALIKGNKSQESRTSTNNTSKHIQIHSKHIQIHPEFAAVWTSEAKASCVDPPHLGSHFATGMDCSCVGWPWQKLEENYEEHVHLLQVLNNRRISETIMGNWQQPNLPNALGLRTHQVTATVSGHQLEESRTVATGQPWEHVTSCFGDHGPHLLESLKYSKRS